MKSLDYVNTDSGNPLYLGDGYSNGDKYLIFTSTNQNEKISEKYTKLWNEVKNQMQTINGGKPIKYEEDFMKIKFKSDDDLPSSKLLNISSLIIVTRSAFEEGSKYYTQVYLHECLDKVLETL